MTAVRERVGEVQDEDGLHAEEREALPDLQTGEGQQAFGLAEERGVVRGGGFAAGLFGLDLDFGSGHGRLLPYKSIDIRSFQVIKNIPVVIRYRLAWTGRALSVIER